MSKKLIIIIVVVLVIAVAAVAIFVFVLGGDKEPPEVYTEYSPGEYFVTNVKDSNRLLKATIVLVLNTDTLEEFLTENNSIIRDTVVFILRNQNEETLKANNLDGLKAEIAKGINERLEIENITDILFSDYALQ